MAVIETPKGSNQKYTYDTSTKFFRLKKCLPMGMVFPFDFGFIPQTKGEDGDPLDIIVISEFKSFPGCLVECRVIGCIAASQSKEKGSKKVIRNDRYIGIPVQSSMFKSIAELTDLPPGIIEKLEHFFINYNKEEGKQFSIKKKLGQGKSLKLIEKNRNSH